MMRTLAVAAAALLLTACGGGDEVKDRMGEQAYYACSDFAEQKDPMYTSADLAARQDYARTVNEWARPAGGAFTDAGAGLARSADQALPVWQSAMDVFARTCLDHGWPTT